ncbi:hypothetical protein PHYSODRAFT_342502 [Phytophthora sojae]|uniref:FH2 domain-containing protein n=1 Tax=Phytophthora sojae (strain P6497) TaxID=1094619 RepID=G5AGS9_PHYSP|nr:hypothetical protein PHYSODRAFT_342502 [Phytophthora sojae]EGZ05359.1 hypothetical protein PHYSODRAFT_342502 [Phytophthora sojae]|eukprot:XP_009539280.1 hypothetical protein PHYSODRAFT_342502 [Phytophthora sojae]
MSLANTLAAATSTTPAPPKLDTKSALPSELKTARKSTETSAASSGESKYTLMLKRGVPFEAVQNCMRKDGVDPSTLKPLPPVDKAPADDGDAGEVADAQKKMLKDMEEYSSYFRMLRMGCPKEAVKKVNDGRDRSNNPDLGPEAVYDEVKDRIAATQSVSKLQDDIKCVNSSTSNSEKDAASEVLLKDHEVYAKYFKMLKMGLPEGTVRQKMKADGMDDRALELGGGAMVSQLAGASGGNGVKLQDNPTYAKYFKMLKTGLPEGAVRQKMKTEGVDERALDLVGDAFVSELISSNNDVKLQDDPVYSKYFKMLKMGLPEGAVKQKMVKENADVRALDLGPDATPKRPRKKLHWQPISEDRLSNLNQQTIWEDEDDDVDFDMDMDELEALFFANQNPGYGKKNSSRGQSKALKRKRSVTLIDGKRAMNAAISLARVKLSYTEIAQAVIKFDPNGLTLEQLVGIIEFLPTSEEAALVSGAELSASLSHLLKAGEELGNTLNGRGEDNGIKGFTVDSLLRLGHTNAVNQKTTVLHYLVRLVKKNHPARESFDTFDEEYKKLEKGLTSLNNELVLLEKQQAVESLGLEVTIKSMQTATSDIEAQMEALKEGIDRAQEEVSSVLDYFGEDPKRNPTEFFTTLMFQRARNEVDAADEAAQRAALEDAAVEQYEAPAEAEQRNDVEGGVTSDSRAITDRTRARHTAFRRKLMDGEASLLLCWSYYT